MELFLIGIFVTLIWVLLGTGVWGLMVASDKYDTNAGQPLVLFAWPIVLLIEAFT